MQSNFQETALQTSFKSTTYSLLFFLCSLPHQTIHKHFKVRETTISSLIPSQCFPNTRPGTQPTSSLEDRVQIRIQLNGKLNPPSPFLFLSFLSSFTTFFERVICQGKSLSFSELPHLYLGNNKVKCLVPGCLIKVVHHYHILWLIIDELLLLIVQVRHFPPAALE